MIACFILTLWNRVFVVVSCAFKKQLLHYSHPRWNRQLLPLTNWSSSITWSIDSFIHLYIHCIHSLFSFIHVISSRHSSCSVHHISFRSRGPQQGRSATTPGTRKMWEIQTCHLSSTCWWFRNPTNSLRFGSLSHELQGFQKHPTTRCLGDFSHSPIYTRWHLFNSYESTLQLSKFPVVSQICMRNIEIARHKRSWDTHTKVLNIYICFRKKYMNNICIM